MNFDINVAAGLAAGVAAMVPGSIIYMPAVLGRRWMKEIGMTEKEMKEGNPGQAIAMMLVTSLINGVVASVIVATMGAETVLQALEVCMMLAWFWVSASLMLVFFERRSWALFGINSLSHVTTFAVIGIVLGLFL